MTILDLGAGCVLIVYVAGALFLYTGFMRDVSPDNHPRLWAATWPIWFFGVLLVGIGGIIIAVLAHAGKAISHRLHAARARIRSLL